MSNLIVVDNPRDWPLAIPGVTAVPARACLTDPAYGSERSVGVFNLCNNFRYQTLGHYVSLLAEARGHRPLPRASEVPGFLWPDHTRRDTLNLAHDKGVSASPAPTSP
jgi:hypothetical protein